MNQEPEMNQKPATIEAITQQGEGAGEVELNAELFAATPNIALMHQVVSAQLGAKRAGTHSTKKRNEVRGGGAKPWRQKGTGRARAGSRNSPIWRGGGIAHGPKPRDYAQRTPKKMKRAALAGALSDRVAAERIIVVDEWNFEVPKTKQAIEALESIGAEGKTLIVLDSADTTAAKSFQNLGHIKCIPPAELNTHDVLDSDWVVFTKTTLAAVQKSGEL